MAMNWNEYELELEAKDHKECEVTGRDEDSKPFFVHTMTDDGVTSDYADAKEAYADR